MKKVFAISLLASLFLCGCQVKEIEGDVREATPFTATIDDSFSDDGTKTSLDSYGTILWTSGDRVSIFVGSTINEQYQVSDNSAGKSSASLMKVSQSGGTFTTGTDINNNVAFYPYSAGINVYYNADGYTFDDVVLPSTQYYAENSFGNGAFPMVAITESTNDYQLKFKNVLGGLKLQLKGTATITSISVRGNNNETLCGDAEVTASLTAVPQITMTGGSGCRSVTLNCGEGVRLNTSTATSFVIALPPVTMSDGFTVVVRDSEGKEMEIPTTNSQTIARSNILSMPEVNYVGQSKPLTLTAIGDIVSIRLSKVGSPADVTLEYRIGNDNWSEYTIGTSVNLSYGESVQFRAGEGGNDNFSSNSSNLYQFSSDTPFNVSGQIMSLLDKDNTRNTVPANAFFSLFKQSSVVDASELVLSATTLAENCYRNMFSGCNNLQTAPELPATTLAENCYRMMFYQCGSLTAGPSVIPAATMEYQCCQFMFYGCTSLTAAPEIQATTMAYLSCADMFCGCTSLTEAPNTLPATTLAYHCYQDLFKDCKITIAPELPATTLAEGCYYGMFMGCTLLEEAPDLPAATLEDECYKKMFYGCSNLRTAPVLPATTLAASCYESMFEGARLTTAPALPATTLANSCYCNMFKDCCLLTAAPELPATTLASNCYIQMFMNCTQLSTTAALPATILAENCYYQMFKGCTHLATAPALSATTMAPYCCYGMFMDCTSLITPPAEIPASTMELCSCYNMFIGCSALATAPLLPATTLANSCYFQMFADCSSLTAAPVLPATSLVERCYDAMFDGCTNLNYVKALFTTTPSDTYTAMWLNNVAATGTFVKSYDAEWDVTGADGVPTGWDVVLDDDGREAPFTITSYGSTSVSIVKNGSPADITLKYRKGTGSWAAYTIGTAINLTSGESVQFRAGEGGNAAFSTSTDFYQVSVGGSGNISASGNIMSLLDKSLQQTSVPEYCFMFLFSGCTKLYDISGLELPATTLNSMCYVAMFENCNQIQTAPALPAKSLAFGCYENMFMGCTKLDAAPALPATTLVARCYNSMFQGCTQLTVAPELPATNLTTACYENMFYGCTNLQAAPQLPAESLQPACYHAMFKNCTHLETAPDLPALYLVNECYKEMFYGCTSLNYVSAMFTTIPSGLNNPITNWLDNVAESGTFYRNSNATWTLEESCIPGGWEIISAVL